MNGTRVSALVLALLMPGVREVGGDELQIGIVDVYGLGRIPEGDVRRVLTVKEGDSVSQCGDEPPAFMAESERRLSGLPGVARAHVGFVCCEEGRWIVYVGLEEPGRAAPHLRVTPTGSARLAADVVQAGVEFDKVFMSAVERGDTLEDRAQGHALSHDPVTRAVQELFGQYAARDTNELQRVLRESSDAAQRALAAQVLGYAAHKQDVVEDLAYAMSDPSEEVRNNAMRTLALFAGITPTSGRSAVRIPIEPFVALINSPVWTDRNKASLALEGLTAGRDPRLLQQLQRKALTALAEMARWKSKGHASPALTILGRIGGLADDDIAAAVARDDRERIIRAALPRR